MGGLTKYRYSPSQTTGRTQRRHDFILFCPFRQTPWFRVLFPLPWDRD